LKGKWQESGRVDLQERVCRAGASTDLVRVALLLGFWSWLLLVPLALIELAAGWGRGFGALSAPRLLLDLGLGLAGGWFALSFAAFPVAAAYRRFRQEQLLRQLAGLPRDEAAAVLLPLQGYCFPDTRAITDDLIRRLRLQGSELCPAAGAAGLGTEPLAPPEEAHAQG
jgi:hypothetical protein